MSVLRNDEKDINNFKCTSKTHSTLDDKKFIPLYSEHIHFIVKGAGCLVTAIHQHFTFEQAKFKKDFIISWTKNLGKRQEFDFYKVLNDVNFGIDCRNKIGNCTLEPIYDEISEIAYI